MNLKRLRIIQNIAMGIIMDRKPGFNVDERLSLLKRIFND